MELTIKLRRDNAATWTSVNPILAEGEVGIELDTRKSKVGDGVTPWNSLAYSNVVPHEDITPATHTKITYDAQGIITAGTDITLSDVTDITATSAEVNVLDGITSTTSELNQLHGSNIETTDLTKLHNITADANELNILDGATLTTTELNYVDGVTSSIQGQIGTLSNLTTDAKGSLQAAINEVDAHADTNASNISDIQDLIPAQATDQNQLADKEFVNSSVATNTGNFIGTFNSIAERDAYTGEVTNNDYCFVINSVIKNNGNDWASFNDLNAYDKSLVTNFDYAWVIDGSKFDLYRFDIVNQVWEKRAEDVTKEEITLNSAYNRYKAVANNATVTWVYEYTLNNSSFTANQWAAINSGATTTNIGQITTNKNAIGTLTSLTTDTKTDLVSAINEIDSHTDGKVADVTVNGNTVVDVSTKVAAIPLTTQNGGYGLVKLGQHTQGLQIDAGDGNLKIFAATEQNITDKNNLFRPITPGKLDFATIEGLSSNAYTLSDAEDSKWTTAKQLAALKWLGAVKDVTIDNASIVDANTKVAAIPQATPSIFGVIKVNAEYGIDKFSNGTITIKRASNTDIDTKTNAYLPIVPSNLDYAVKVGITTNTNTLTSAEQTAALSWLGAQGAGNYVTTDTAQDITATKTFKAQQKIQSGATDGALILGADLNATTLTNGARKLARVAMPTNEMTGNLMLICGETLGDASSTIGQTGSSTIYNRVEFGSRPGNTSAYAPDGIGFTVAKVHNSLLAADKIYALEMNKDQARFNVQPNYNGNNLLTANEAVTYTMNNDVVVCDNTKNVAKVTPECLYVKDGLIMGGTAAAAGLVTRGICGSSGSTSGPTCTKDHLFINYDGDNTYRSTRQLVLQAGGIGSGYGNNVWAYCAVRGDAMKGFVENITGLKENLETTAKTNLVAAINEINGAASRGLTVRTWSA